ncbi:hypothetical protein FLBR109950_15450 [Flavobacterium branchiophilum]|uniref:Uncharacterized protein n=1 Tax=Flavobacterium branchiophilum (strain FL-15) TaxID=1034807 RepID=G2Z5P6_FLABF|nr:hypothetical protein [Flavobacterium branchiophilum]CCB70844.1 Hypothetical protein FBFL15_2883 [Flavobacterium branchiophilum FL-15]
MKKVNIQFYSTIDENILFIKNLFELNEYKILLRIDEPKLNIIITSENIENIKELLFENNLKYWSTEVYFSKSKFNIDQPFNVFSDFNTNSMFLKIGKQDNTSLEESWLATSLKFDDEELLKRFVKIGNELKKNTSCGGYYNEGNWKKGKFDKLIRYTEGALKFNQQGGLVYQFNPKINFILEK